MQVDLTEGEVASSAVAVSAAAEPEAVGAAEAAETGEAAEAAEATESAFTSGADLGVLLGAAAADFVWLASRGDSALRGALLRELHARCVAAAALSRRARRLMRCATLWGETLQCQSSVDDELLSCDIGRHG